MSQKTVNHNGKSYLVENAISTLLCVTRNYGNGETKTFTIEEIGMALNDAEQSGSKGIATSIVEVATTDTLGGSKEQTSFRGVFDETKVNGAGFGNLLKRTIINAIFNEFLDIEPLNMDGTVKPEFQ